MKLTITIEMDNAAFDDGPELERILLQLAPQADDMIPGDEIRLRDTNGNLVGLAKATGR